MSNQLIWSEAEIFNARFESYDVYRAIVDPVTSEIGDYVLLVSLPITYDWDMAILSQTLEYLDEDVEADTTYAYKVIANASNGAGDPDGDFTQVSNVIQLVVAPGPEVPSGFLHLVWRNGNYELWPSTLDALVLASFVDMGLGFVYGITAAPAEEGLPELGVNGAALEAVAVAAASSIDMGEVWERNGAPIYTGGSNRHNRITHGDGIWFMGGTLSTGLGTAAFCTGTVGISAFSWTSVTAALGDAVPANEGGDPEGVAGVGFHNGFFYVYTNGGRVARAASSDLTTWEAVGTGGPTETWNTNTAHPQARFASTGNMIAIMYCGYTIYSPNNGANWDMASVTEAAGFPVPLLDANPPRVFGLAAGGGLLVAGYRIPLPDESFVAGVSVATISNDEPGVSWAQIEIPDAPSGASVQDLVYDSAGQRFIGLVYDFDDTYGSTYMIFTMSLEGVIEVTFSGTVDDGGTEQAGYLAYSDVEYTPPVVEDFVALGSYSIEAIGGSGSGNQEPNITLIIGAGDAVPLGQLYLGGGAANGLYNPAFLIDDETTGVVDPDPLAISRASFQPTGQWWFGEDPPDPAEYEVRVVPQLGSTDPATGAVNEWISMADEPTWQWFGVFGPPANAIWDVQIRSAINHQVLAEATWNITQNVG
jgi:hypothetical protein